ncbi:MAG: phosphodiester glycosidase family protein [Brevibacterium yomogidense]
MSPSPTRSLLTTVALAAALVAPGAVLVPGLPGTSAPAQAAPTDDQLGADGSVLRSSETSRVAPGLELTNFSRMEDGGWNNGNVLTADLTEDSLSVDVADTGVVAGSATTSEVMASGEHGGQAVAAVNGTFFDINHTDAPIYSTVSQSELRVGTQTPMPSLTITGQQAAVQMLSASGTLTADGDEHELGGLNNPQLSADTIGVYTAAWGDYTLDRPVGGPDALADDIARVTVVDGEVVDASGLVDEAGDPEIPEGGQVLLGREDGAHALADLEVGDDVDVEIGPSVDVDSAIAGSNQILTDGEVPDMGSELATGIHPRTAVGMSKDGTELFVTTIDGRSGASRGMTLPEMGEFFQDLGAHNAVNLDGGGSTTMVARPAGAQTPTVQNSPSDGEERNVPNSLVFYSDAPAEQLSDVQLDTSLDDQDTVLQGMHRTYDGTGLGENLDPIEVSGTFETAAGTTLAEADGATATIRGDETGTSRVSYSAEGHTARKDLRVLGEAIGLRASSRALNLTEVGDTAEITIDGFDSDGRAARIESRDLEVEASDGIDVSVDELGTYVVTATDETAGGSVTFHAGDATTSVPVTVGTEVTDVVDFGDLDAFSDETARATGSFSAGEPTDDGQPSLAMEYDFSQSSATRGYYLISNDPVTVDGNTLAFEMMVHGDGTGAWPRLQVRGADGVVTNLDGDHLDFEGWQKVRFEVPTGLAQPLTFERIRIMETRPGEQYSGDIAVAGLQAVSTPEAAPSEETPVHDPALLATGSVADRPQNIAVMSDAQFVAANPDSDAVDGARRTLKEIQGAEPDMLVINGDFVDEAAAEDFALAQQILDEEWTEDIPYVYVPGNHEVMGGEISNFEDAFGPTATERSLGRTKAITLNTASGSLRDGDTDQLQMLEEALEEVGESEHLTGAAVFFHHPPQDPLPSKSSQLSDRREAEELEELLGDFREDTGKSAAVVNGHVGVFHGSAVDGVSYMITGNSGKNPSGTAANGGFTGWTMLGVDPGLGEVGGNPTTTDRVAWLAAETRPWVDEISVTAPEAMTPGQTAEVSAEFTQDDRTVPVGWPVTSQWGGDGVIVDGGDQAVGGSSAAAVARDAQAGGAAGAAGAEAGDGAAPGGVEALEAGAEVVRVNPRTGEITAVQPGTATVSVTVNGRTAETTVVVAGDDEPGPDPTGEPSDETTGEPTADPTGEPTQQPTGEPTDAPTGEPTGEPTEAPTGEPTGTPTGEPTGTPTGEPTGTPTDNPTSDPTGEPTGEPTEPGSPEPTDSESPDAPRPDESDDPRGGSDDDENADRGDDGTLPRTGAQVGLALALGGILIVAGLVVTRLARRES